MDSSIALWIVVLLIGNVPFVAKNRRCIIKSFIFTMIACAT